MPSDHSSRDRAAVRRAIGNRIAGARKRKFPDLTQTQANEKLGLSYDRLGQWERGNEIPRADVLLELCEQLEVSADHLLGLRLDPLPDSVVVDDEAYEKIMACKPGKLSSIKPYLRKRHVLYSFKVSPRCRQVTPEEAQRLEGELQKKLDELGFIGDEHQGT